MSLPSQALTGGVDSGVGNRVATSDHGEGKHAVGSSKMGADGTAKGCASGDETYSGVYTCDPGLRLLMERRWQGYVLGWPSCTLVALHGTRRRAKVCLMLAARTYNTMTKCSGK